MASADKPLKDADLISFDLSLVSRMSSRAASRPKRTLPAASIAAFRTAGSELRNALLRAAAAAGPPSRAISAILGRAVSADSFLSCF